MYCRCCPTGAEMLRRHLGRQVQRSRPHPSLGVGSIPDGRGTAPSNLFRNTMPASYRSAGMPDSLQRRVTLISECIDATALAVDRRKLAVESHAWRIAKTRTVLLSGQHALPRNPCEM